MIPLLLAAPIIPFSPDLANAADVAVYTPEPAPAPAPAASMFDVAFGVALTTDYISRGITNSDSDPAIQGYIEASYGMAYVNVWSSNVDYGDGFSGAEIDLAVGLRPEWNSFSFDLGYVHYFYTPEHVSPDYGEFYAKVNYNYQDMFTTSGRVYFAPDYSQSGSTGTYVEAALEVPLPWDFSFSGGIGYQFFEDSYPFEQLAWNLGLSYTWKSIKLDVRYWDTDLSGSKCVVRSGFSDGCDARVVGTISFDTSWSSLMGN